MKRANKTDNVLLVKEQFKLWLEEEQKSDEMIVIATIPHILKRFDSRLVIVKENCLEKRYLSEWRKLFRIDREMKREKCLINLK